MSRFMRFEVTDTPQSIENHSGYPLIGGEGVIQNRGRSPVFLARAHELPDTAALVRGAGFKLEAGQTIPIDTASIGAVIEGVTVTGNEADRGDWWIWTAAGRSSSVYISWDFNVAVYTGVLIG